MSIIVFVFVVLVLIKGNMPIEEKYDEIAFWGLVLKSMLKSPTTIRREILPLRLFSYIAVFMHSKATLIRHRGDL